MASSVGPSALILANFLRQVEDRFQELGLLVLDELQGAAPQRFRDVIPSMQLVHGEWRQGGWQYDHLRIYMSFKFLSVYSADQ